MALAPAPELDRLLTRYDTLAQLVEQALAACAGGDRERAILLACAAVQQTAALDRHLRKLDALPEC